ncbi:Prolyl 4-hydroxylase subunit [Dirofilaria immitis]
MIDIAVISAATAFIGIDIAIISLEWPLLLNCLTGKCEPGMVKFQNLEIEIRATHSCGIGGYFKPHIDCVNKGNQSFKYYFEMGERIATILITEPEIEDRTIFTSNSKISLLCTKNAAFFWYNLMRTGEIDMRSRYVAFPVLTGIKWAVTKWLRGQKLRRPRGLSRFDQERYMGDLGAPGPKRYLNIRSEANPKKKKKKKNKY